MLDNWMEKVKLLVNVALWYGLTIVSTIYSKDYLQKFNDPIVLSMISFFTGTCLVPFIMTFSEIRELIKADMVRTVAILHIGTTLMTNIGMTTSTVSFTYMVKASEPICVALLLAFVMGKSWPYKMYAALIVIFIGVTITVYGEMNVSLIGLISVILSNISSASRNVFYNQSHAQHPTPTTTSTTTPTTTSINVTTSFFKTYVMLCFASFLLFLPLFLLNQFLYMLNSTSNSGPLDKFMSSSLFYGAVFHFSYNSFSFLVLKNVSTVTHSIINVMKRIVIIVSSLLHFQNTLTSLQAIGIVVSNIGILLYVKFKNMQKKQQQQDDSAGLLVTAPTTTATPPESHERKRAIVGLLVFLIYLFGFCEILNLNYGYGMISRGVGAANLTLAKS